VLKEWQERLDSHYAAVRKDRPTARPIFALEHGLSDTEFTQLQQTIRKAVREKYFSADEPLPWVVYAAEVGYQYAGDEYWETFESKTLGWQDFGERNWIRDCFLKFRDKFSAATPTGVWASHFSIICWPITHAILPKDLQRQLALLLYDLRLAFRREHFESPDQLGELLAANSWNTSSRFQYLLQTPALVGQAFFARFDRQSADDVLDVIRRTMPQEAPDTLGMPAYADIVSYLLKSNGSPAGKTELPTMYKLGNQWNR
jgi:hypothetical protein